MHKSASREIRHSTESRRRGTTEKTFNKDVFESRCQEGFDDQARNREVAAFTKRLMSHVGYDQDQALRVAEAQVGRKIPRHGRRGTPTGECNNGDGTDTTVKRTGKTVDRKGARSALSEEGSLYVAGGIPSAASRSIHRHEMLNRRICAGPSCGVMGKFRATRSKTSAIPASPGRTFTQPNTNARMEELCLKKTKIVDGVPICK